MHALRLFFPPSPLSPLFSHSPPLFFLSLCCVSDTTPLFYQINISQNKSQDNFKLASEEKGREERRRDREGERERENSVQFARFL